MVSLPNPFDTFTFQITTFGLIDIRLKAGLGYKEVYGEGPRLIFLYPLFQ
jgi:hypothetical protein